MSSKPCREIIAIEFKQLFKSLVLLSLFIPVSELNIKHYWTAVNSKSLKLIKRKWPERASYLLSRDFSHEGITCLVSILCAVWLLQDNMQTVASYQHILINCIRLLQLEQTRMVLACKWCTCITSSVHISCDRSKHFNIRWITGLIFDLTLVSKNKSMFPQMTWPLSRTCSTGFNRCERLPINGTVISTIQILFRRWSSKPV